MKEIKFSDIQEDIKKALDTALAEEVRRAEPSGFTILDGFVNQPFQKDLSSSFVVGGPSLPLVVVVGNTTGRIYHFALKKLLPNLEFD